MHTRINLVSCQPKLTQVRWHSLGPARYTDTPLAVDIRQIEQTTWIEIRHRQQTQDDTHHMYLHTHILKMR